jgi:ABC-type amino acid transport substrate-binding protein
MHLCPPDAVRPPWLPERNCQELRTALRPAKGEHRDMPHRRLPKPPIRVLLISSQAATRESLAAQVQAVLPEAQVQSVAAFADAVLRLAQGDIQLVLLDMPSLAPLSPAAPLMLRGLAPGAHLLARGAAVDELGFERLADAQQLPDWLRRWR